MTRLRALVVGANLAMGAAVYLLLRDKGILAFETAHRLGMSGPIDFARAAVTTTRASAPDVVRFVLPDGCWALAGTFFFASIWRRRAGLPSLLWTTAIPAIGIASEIGQWLAVVPGTFDLRDLIAYAVGGAVGALLGRQNLSSDHSAASEAR